MNDKFICIHTIYRYVLMSARYSHIRAMKSARKGAAEACRRMC